MQLALDTLLKALADPTRRTIFERLNREGELTVVALTRDSDVSQPAISKHLARLKEAGLVLDRHQGRETHYSALPGALIPLKDWTHAMADFRETRFDKLEDLVKRMA